MVYFTSDLHFGHANIIKYCNRPYDSVEEMDKALINNWNATVKQEDAVYIIGDFTMREAGVAKGYLSALNGTKYLIVGNHDMFLKSFGATTDWFGWVDNYAVINHNGAIMVLFHYPIVEWHGFSKGSIHLYGHLHNSTSVTPWDPTNTRAFNVGVDVNDYKPISATEIIRRANKIPISKRHRDQLD